MGEILCNEASMPWKDIVSLAAALMHRRGLGGSACTVQSVLGLGRAQQEDPSRRSCFASCPASVGTLLDGFKVWEGTPWVQTKSQGRMLGGGAQDAERGAAKHVLLAGHPLQVRAGSSGRACSVQGCGVFWGSTKLQPCTLKPSLELEPWMLLPFHSFNVVKPVPLKSGRGR